MKNLKYILTGLFTASTLAMVSPAMAAEDAPEETEIEEEIQEVVTYDDSDLDDLLNLDEIDLVIEETELEQTSYKDENTIEIKEEDKSHPDRVEIKGSNRNATGTDKEPGRLAWRNYRQGDLANFDIRTKIQPTSQELT